MEGRDTGVYSHLFLALGLMNDRRSEMSRIGKSIGTENRLVVALGWGGEGSWGVTANIYRGLWGDRQSKCLTLMWWAHNPVDILETFELHT